MSVADTRTHTPGAELGAVVSLAEVRNTPLSQDEVSASLAHPAAGGVVVFTGLVRNHDEGLTVATLDYSSHPTADASLSEVLKVVAGRHDVLALSAIHRVGQLQIGDLAVVCGASAAHRDVAFAAARDLIDTVKAHVPIWKEQQYGDGARIWVGST